jgi:hypothetical protein
MRQRIRSHLTYANVMATIAVFLALGGVGAYAANTVGSSDVINDSLLSQDIKGKGGTSTTAAENGTLTGVDISGQAANPAVGQPFVDGSLTGADIKNSSLTGAEVQNGAIGSGKLASSALGARAYGLIQTNASVSRSKNITGVTNPSTGTFCLTLGGGIDPSTASAVVTPDYETDGTGFGPNRPQAIAEVRSVNHVDCPAGTLEVLTGYRDVVVSGGAVTSVDNVLSNGPFFIVVG